jgi:hypothetical protein
MDEIDPAAENIDLSAEQIVAADTAMLLDLGGAEELADLIATQALGVGDTVADRASLLDVHAHGSGQPAQGLPVGGLVAPLEAGNDRLGHAEPLG